MTASEPTTATTQPDQPSLPEQAGQGIDPAPQPQTGLLGRIPAAWRTRQVAIIAGAAVVLVALGVALGIALGDSPGTPTEPAAERPVDQGEDTATIGQYAGLIAESDFLETEEKFSDALCGFDPDPSDRLTCSLISVTLGLQAKTLVITLSGSRNPDSPGYLGSPPAEIADLVQQTIEDAQAVDDASTAVSADVNDKDAAAHLWLVTNTLVNTLKRWQPYL